VRAIGIVADALPGTGDRHDRGDSGDFAMAEFALYRLVPGLAAG
jgi:hypothetical protein